MKGLAVNIYDDLRRHFSVIGLSFKLLPLSWQNAVVLEHFRNQLLYIEMRRKYFCLTPCLLRIWTMISRLLMLRWYYFFQLLPNYKQIKKAIHLPEQYKPNSELEPKKLNQLYKKLSSMHVRSKSFDLLKTEPALELNEVIIDNLFLKVIGIRLDRNLLKILRVIEKPSLAILLFLRLCGCPDCEFVLSADQIIGLMVHHVTSRIHYSRHTEWIDVDWILKEDKENIDGTIKIVSKTQIRVSSLKTCFDTHLITFNMYFQSKKFLDRHARTSANDSIFAQAIDSLLKNLKETKL